MSALHVVILAAGQGKRMRSALPKVLHPIGAQPLLSHVLTAVEALSCAGIHVVHGHGSEQVLEAIEARELNWVLQPEQLGTGHAVQQAMGDIPDGVTVLVLYGDVPLVNPTTLAHTVDACRTNSLGLITAVLDDPSGYGRIIRDSEHRVCAIVEHRDANPEQLGVREINTGIMALPSTALRRWLGALPQHNVQGEFYLTDVVAMAVAEAMVVHTVTPPDPVEVMGVNDRIQLATLERAYQRREVERLMLGGVSVADPSRLDIRGQVRSGIDVVIDVNVVLEGVVSLGDGVRIGPNCVIRDAQVAAGTEIKAHSVIDSAILGRDCVVGPFARLRPGVELAEAVHIGNFVEVKNAKIGPRTKANHLTYLGDAELGSDTNVGAGTITCNYDGVNKHRTIIGDRVFVGSGVELVAPLTLADGSTIGAGSTISKSTPAQTLTVARSREVTYSKWKRPTKKS